ncbi:hypothetical protein O181_086347 [Austropuccinia psidii MF-1]|uniref:Uncharacterized protein n=1 Tax=Austropuccinia psidii MF-1 TaxID=1389203 RepID=A0A9Q3FZL6_9BASI|nr:hypothetical protein [Austropuccinia psidii MF-1]
MIIVHKYVNIHKNSGSLRRFPLPITPGNPAYVPSNAEPQTTIEGINITDLGTELHEEARKCYKDRNCHILTCLLYKYCKYTALANSLDDIFKTSYYNVIFH